MAIVSVKKIMAKVYFVIILILGFLFQSVCVYAQNVEQTLKVCVLEDDPPYTFKDKNGQWQGYDIDILHAFNLPYDIQFIGTDFATSLAMLNSEQCNMFLASVPMTQKYKDRFLVSYPHVTSNLHFMVQKDSPIDSVEKLQYIIIGVLKGSSAEDYALKHLTNSTLIALRHESKLVELLYEGEIDVLIGDRPKLHEIQAMFSDLEIIEPPLKEEQCSFVFSQKSDALRDIINSKIIEIEDEGILLSLYDKWFRKAKYSRETYGK